MASEAQPAAQPAKKMDIYTYLLIIPILLFLGSIRILVQHYFATGQFFDRSIELTGGNLITVSIDKEVNVEQLTKDLSKFGSMIITQSVGFNGRQLFIQTDYKQIQDIIKELNILGIKTESFSTREIGASLGEAFWSQVQVGIIAAFIAMSIVIFIVFRSPGPSFNVIFAALADIITSLAFMQIFGIKLSLASFAGILMLIGYSIDTDIVLATRVLKTEEGTLKEKTLSAMKTGMTMIATTLGVLTVLYVSNISPILSEIAAVLIIGLVADMIYTWIQNAAVLRYIVRRRERLHA